MVWLVGIPSNARGLDGVMMLAAASGEDLATVKLGHFYRCAFRSGAN